jgi:hypothetical protein
MVFVPAWSPVHGLVYLEVTECVQNNDGKNAHRRMHGILLGFVILLVSADKVNPIVAIAMFIALCSAASQGFMLVVMATDQ